MRRAVLAFVGGGVVGVALFAAAPAGAVLIPAGSLLHPAGNSACLSEQATSRGWAPCQENVGDLDSVAGIAASPDGRDVYVNSVRAGRPRLITFRRAAKTGRLSRAGCLGSRPCAAKIRGLEYVYSVAVSSDGRYVYAAGDGVAVFARDRVSGELTQLAGRSGCLVTGASKGCGTFRSQDYPASHKVLVSPDGKNVYDVGSFGFDTVVAVLDRAPDGSLSQSEGPAGCLASTPTEGCATVRTLQGLNDLTITPDGRQVLGTAFYEYETSGTLVDVMTVLDRSETGRLTQPVGKPECYSPQPAKTMCAPGPVAFGEVAVSPDGTMVVAGAADAIFARNPGTGALTPASGKPAPGRGSNRGSNSIEFAPDGKNLYLFAEDSGVRALRRSGVTLKKLRRPFSCVTPASKPGCIPGRALSDTGSLTISPDGRNVYAASFSQPLSGPEPSGIAVFDRVRTAFRAPRAKTRIRGVPHRCVSRAFKVRVTATTRLGARSITISRDHRRLAKKAGAAVRVKVPVRRLHTGPHRLRVSVRDGIGAITRKTVRFRRCGPR